MIVKGIFYLAALFGGIAYGAQGGGTTIVNNTPNPLYLWSVSNIPGPMNTLAPNGGSYYEAWRLNPDGGGISIKISTTPTDAADLLQFEYTLKAPLLWWDLSGVNMDPNSPFHHFGFNGIPTDTTCLSATCGPGDVSCHDSYNSPHEDWAMRVCNSASGVLATIGL